MRGKLIRSSDDVMVGGVCAGLAHNFSADPSLVRLIMAFLILGAGVGVLPYIILWMILPATATKY